MVNGTHTSMEKGWVSPVAVHPGIFLQNFLDNYPMTQEELSKRIGLTPKGVNDIVKGKTGVTSSTALKLSKVFNVSASFWNNLQEQYESDLARIEEEKKIQNEIKAHLSNFQETYKELCTFNLIEKFRWVEKNYFDIVRSLQKFYGASSLSFVESELVAGALFRKYERKKINPYTVAAWVRVGESHARNKQVSSYDVSKLKKSLPVLKKLSTKNPAEYLPEAERILAECGVVLVYMPYFKNTHVQGAVKWLSKDKVAILINGTKRSEDKFWFSLFHEIGHVIKHGKKNKDSNSKVYIDLDEKNENEVEKEADAFAQEQLIPGFDSWLTKLATYADYRKAIIDISKELEISPAIFAGRIAHEFDKKGDNLYPVLSEFWATSINYTNILRS